MALGVIALAFAALLGLVVGRRWAVTVIATAWLVFFFWNHIAAEQSVHGHITVAKVLGAAPLAALTAGLVLGAGLAGVATHRGVRRLARRLVASL